MKNILLLHGALGSKENFSALEEILAAKFKTHSLNFSGHGRTVSHHHAFTIQNFAHEVLDWLNKEMISTTDIFGYSMGGYVALHLARFYPQRVGKIFTLGTKLKWSEAEAEREMKMLNAEKIQEKVPAFARSLAQKHGEHEWKSVLHKTSLMMRDLAHTHLTDDDFKKIEHHVLLGLGEKDSMVTKEETEHVHTLLKNSEFKIFKDVLHPIEKVPVELLSETINKLFLSSIEK